MDLNEPYSPSTPRPAATTVAMKTVLYLIIAFVIAQLVGAVLFGLYLHMKLDKVEDEMNLREEFLFLRRLQKCLKPQDADKTLLDCTAILNIFQDLRDRTSVAEKLHGTRDSDLPSRTFSAATTRKDDVIPFWDDVIPFWDDVIPSPEMMSYHSPVPWKFCGETMEFLLNSRVPEESTTVVQKGKKPTASIHLAGFQDNSQPASVLQWTEALYAPSDSTFSYQDGKLKVDRGGRYYIYAQVTFCVKSEPHEPFSVYMYLHLPSERDQLLLKGMRTPGSTDNICSLQSVHLGRVVELQQGHTVFINVTNSSRVNYDHGNTYFGMFEISEKSP
ncbi:UNVERIFIED_CONTAM: hypothetical protein K2H54_034468 [Gekko kuhli]